MTQATPWLGSDLPEEERSSTPRIVSAYCTMCETWASKLLVDHADLSFLSRWCLQHAERHGLVLIYAVDGQYRIVYPSTAEVIEPAQKVPVYTCPDHGGYISFSFVPRCTTCHRPAALDQHQQGSTP